MSLSDDKPADIVDAFNTTSSYFEDILNINNIYFDKYGMICLIYPSELQMKPIPLTWKPGFFDLFVSYEIVSSKIYDKHEYFDLEIVQISHF